MPLQIELHRNEQLWDQHSFRRTYPDTPHGQMTDIIARYMPEGLVNITTRRAEHRNVFWPAWNALPSLRPLVFGLMARVQGVELGSILLTKLQPGGEILPHSDRGSWAPEYYQTKAHITVAGSALVRVENEEERFEQGSIWTFDNLREHQILNDGDCDRIVVIVSMRSE
jgi:mannose-6-phosphate isomerase-like protein (cupin superfamily)